MGAVVERRNNYIAGQIREMSLTSDDIVLDIGAGLLDRRALVSAGHYVATDIRELSDLDFAADGGALPMRTASVRVLLGLELLEHVPDPNRILSEASRVLAAGGKAFFSVPATFPRHDTYDYWRFTPQGLEVAGRAAFRDIKVLVFGHTFETLGVIAAYYVQLAAHRFFGPLERAVPRMEAAGAWLDNRAAWARSRDGLHTLQSDLLLVCHQPTMNARGS